ncbi:MAG: response regulator [Gemmatimonadaceae bacterium]|nr:response regulator [Gemmatimonadaceae bacterium]
MEDTEINRQVAYAMLTQLGCRVTVAAGGLEGVTFASRNSFDLILMDCQMPIVDGFEATRRIRAAEGEGSRTPIVALTANALQGDRERCLAAGMDDYLSKPFSRQALRQVLDRWLPTSTTVAAAGNVDLCPRAETDILDPQALADVRLMDPDGSLLRGIVTLYLDDGAKLLAAVTDAQGAGDLEALAFSAHTLKSSSGCIGARQVMSYCEAIETAARTQRLVCTDEELHRLRTAFAAACAAAREHCDPDLVAETELTA